MSTTTKELAQLMSDAAAFQDIKLSMFKVGQLDPAKEHLTKDVVRLATDNALRALNYEAAINAAPLTVSIAPVSAPDTRRITLEDTGNIVLGELCVWLRTNGFLAHEIPTVDQLRDAVAKICKLATCFSSIRGILTKANHLGPNPTSKSAEGIVGKVSFLAGSPRADENKTLSTKLKRFQAQHANVVTSINAAFPQVKSFEDVLDAVNDLIGIAKATDPLRLVANIGDNSAPAVKKAVDFILAQHGKITSEPAVLALREIREIFESHGYAMTEREKSVPSAFAHRIRGILSAQAPPPSVTALRVIRDAVQQNGFYNINGQEPISEGVAAAMAKVVQLTADERKIASLLERHHLSTERGTVRAIEDALGELANFKLERTTVSLRGIAFGKTHEAHMSRLLFMLGEAGFLQVGKSANLGNVCDVVAEMIDARRKLNAHVEGILRRVIDAGYTSGMGTPLEHISEAVDRMLAAIKKGIDFKTYVHKRLDAAGVSAHPEANAIGANGCRIGKRLDDVLVAAGELTRRGEIIAHVHAVLRNVDLNQTDTKAGVSELAERYINALNVTPDENAEALAEYDKTVSMMREKGFGIVGLGLRKAVKALLKINKRYGNQITDLHADNAHITKIIEGAGYCVNDGLVEAVRFVIDADPREEYFATHSALCNAGMIDTGDIAITRKVRELIASHIKMSTVDIAASSKSYGGMNLTSDTGELVRARLAKAGIVGAGCTTDKLLQEVDLLLLGLRGTPNIKAFWESGNTLAKKLGLPDWSTWSQIFERIDQMTRYQNAGEALADSMRNAGIFQNGVTATDLLKYLADLLAARKNNVSREANQRQNIEHLCDLLRVHRSSTWLTIFDTVKSSEALLAEYTGLVGLLETEGVFEGGDPAFRVDQLQAFIGSARDAMNAPASTIDLCDLFAKYGYTINRTRNAVFAAVENTIKGNEKLTEINDQIDTEIGNIRRVLASEGITTESMHSAVVDLLKRAKKAEQLLAQNGWLGHVGNIGDLLAKYGLFTLNFDKQLELITKCFEAHEGLVAGKKALHTLIEQHINVSITNGFKNINEQVALALEFRRDWLTQRDGYEASKEHITAIGNIFAKYNKGNTTRFSYQLERIEDAFKSAILGKDLFWVLNQNGAKVHHEMTSGELLTAVAGACMKAKDASESMHSAIALRGDLIALLNSNGEKLEAPDVLEVLNAVSRSLKFRRDVMSGGKSVAQDNLRTALVLMLGNFGVSCGNLSNAALIEVLTDWLKFGTEAKTHLRAAGFNDSASAVDVAAKFYAANSGVIMKLVEAGVRNGYAEQAKPLIAAHISQFNALKAFNENSRQGVLAAKHNNDDALRHDLTAMIACFAIDLPSTSNLNMLNAVSRAFEFRAAANKELESINFPGSLNSLQIVCRDWANNPIGDLRKIFTNAGLNVSGDNFNFTNAVRRALQFRQNVVNTLALKHRMNIDTAHTQKDVLERLKVLLSAEAYADDAQHFAAWQDMTGQVSGLYTASAHVMKVSQERLAENKSTEATFGAALAGDLGQLAKDASVVASDFYAKNLASRRMTRDQIIEHIKNVIAPDTEVEVKITTSGGAPSKSLHTLGNAFDFTLKRPFDGPMSAE